MPCTCPFSTTTPAKASHHTVSSATHSANTEVNSTRIGSSGERYTMTRMTNTAASATINSRPSIPRKPFTRSAVKPAGPVTQASTPPGASLATTSRTSSTTSRTSPELSMGTKICAACPSAETTGGEASPATPSMAAISVANV